MKAISRILFAALFVLAPLSSFAGIFISVGIAPPPLPVYVQPICPDDGYIWVPGYWAYGDDGYFWVPGTWVQPPSIGVLWTPGYWGWGSGNFFFHQGYWGPHVGFYGGVNYGFGYGGQGYGGGRWQGGHFFYNSAANNVGGGNFHNTYVDRTTINNTTNNISYNGGRGGVNAQPTAQDRQYSRESHIKPTSVQTAHVQAASRDRGQLASANGGRPATLSAARPSAYKQVAQQHAKTTPMNTVNKTNASTGAEKLPQSNFKPKTVTAGGGSPGSMHKTEQISHKSVNDTTTHKTPHFKASTPSKPKPQPHPKAAAAPSHDKKH